MGVAPVYVEEIIDAHEDAKTFLKSGSVGSLTGVGIAMAIAWWSA